MKVIIYMRPDGGLSVCRPNEGARLAYLITLQDGAVLSAINPPQPVDAILRRWPVEGAVADWAESEDQFVARIRAKDVPADAQNVQIIEESAVPADRTFRNAWKAGIGCVQHDIERCRDIHRDRLREGRLSAFAALDVHFLMEMERLIDKLALSDVDKAPIMEVIAQKKALRDVTADPRIDAAQSPEELKAVIPEALV